MNLPTLQRKLSEIIEEYNQKIAVVDNEVAAFEKAGDALKAACCVGGTWGDTQIDTGSVYDYVVKKSLLKSAWRHAYNGLNVETIAPASDKKRFESAMADPPEFTIDNIRATFGSYVTNPMGNILRGLAEVFCLLDQAYKSHDKVKIGVEGLPKRVIISSVNTFHGYGKDYIRDILNALAAYQGKPLIEWAELSEFFKDGDALQNTRGVTLNKFKNGNGHLIFNKETLKDINRALAEYYGDVLADCHEEKPTKKQESTAVSKDLQYYPTPLAVVERVLDHVYNLKGKRVLEPSCGCGRFLDGLKERGAKAFGIEFDPVRAEQCRVNGHNVLTANFLEVPAEAKYDRVIMNPPFYGKHYAKHVNHALKFLKTDGVLTSILPVTARYDHGLLNGRWDDLPIGSFSESGTNINTTVLTIRKESA